MEHFPYMGKKIYYPFPTFRVNYCYRGVLPSFKTLKQEVVSETIAHYPPTYEKSSVLTYNDLQYLTIQVSLRDNLTRSNFPTCSLIVNHTKPLRIRKTLELTYHRLIFQRTVPLQHGVSLQNIYLLRMT